MSSIAYDLFEAAPSWVRLSIVLGLSYSAYLAWSAVVRFNREWKVASRILDERRKAGIPDTDKRPFRIAKAAVDATRSSSDHTLKHRVTFSSDLHDGLQSSQSSPNNTREEGLERTNVSSTSRSKARRRSSLAPRTSTTSDSKAPGSSRINSPSSPASVAPLDPHQKSDQPSRLKHKRAYAPSEYAPSELSHCGSPDIISQTRTTKKVKTKSTLKSPNKRGLPSTAEINRKKTKLSLPGDLSIQEGPAEDGYGSQEEDSHMTEIEKGRKRILSQAVSEAELSHELKNKRGKSARQPDDDELEREQTDMNDLPPSDGDKMQEDDSLEVDQDVFMIAENGQRKKLITIKPLSDNQSDQQIEEDSTERRWVTRSEFERLKRTAPLTAKLRTSARPRNSLGRMRLSLPPDPVSPARRSRSKINSLLQDDRYIDDRTSGESQLAIQSTSEEQARQPSPNAEVSGRAAQLSSPSETLNTNPVSTPQPQQLHPSSTTGHASTTSTAFNVGTAASKQQAPSGAVQTGNSNTSLFAPKATNSFSFGSAPPQHDKAPPSVSLSEVSKTQPPASSSPFSFGAVAANTGSIASQPLFGNTNASSASSSFAQSTQFSTSETLPKTVAVAPKVDLPKPSPFAFNSISSPAPVKEKSIFQSSESSSAFSFKSTNSPGGDKADKPGFSAGTSQLPPPQPTTKPAASSFSPFGASTTPFSFQTGQPSTKTDNIKQLARSSDPISGASPGHKADAISHNNDTSVKSNTISTTSNFSFGPKSTTDPSSSKQIPIDANAISATSASLSGSGSDSSLTLENDSPSQEVSVSQEKSGSTAGQESTPGRRTARLKSNRLTAGPQRVLANAMSNVGKQVGLSTAKPLQNEPNKSTETIAEEAEPATSSTEDGATKVSTSGDLARPNGFGNGK
ncbi:uncharacterized protein MELLADRAFT_78470 [Melampsora larici-populina 98AG31]|uniref:Uncharacterized protein n=1 Tax=Melampsora larici-populina (strain 98AG31 / pathotype 3-4-7) TaxID=747676 RepID=F4RUS0_MELLP|nr:uncharacterized protein MELLADRAFT_78470 [Melampsora larici-populina 98AG31]EGG03873.1 hypothetical protein MELLADRAFT_78470 [Melampsora larici-populina 98AG31]